MSTAYRLHHDFKSVGDFLIGPVMTSRVSYVIGSIIRIYRKSWHYDSQGGR